MKEKLYEILEEICGDLSSLNCSDSVNLIDEGFLDSLAVAELIVAIEETWGIVLSPTEYDKDEFSTVNKIMNILIEKGITA